MRDLASRTDRPIFPLFMPPGQVSIFKLGFWFQMRQLGWKRGNLVTPIPQNYPTLLSNAFGCPFKFSFGMLLDPGQPNLRFSAAMPWWDYRF